MGKRHRLLLQVLWAAALLLFLVGVVTPIVTIEKFYLVENTFSIVSGVVQLFVEQRYFLFLLILLFSVVLPLMKLVVLYRILEQPESLQGNNRLYLHWIHLYGKWSMLDVFVVAVLVVSVKLGAIADVQMRVGLYAFAVSVLLTMIITARVVTVLERMERQSHSHSADK